MQKTVNYYGKKYKATPGPLIKGSSADNCVQQIEKIELEQEEYKNKRALFIDGVEGVDVPFTDGRKYTKKRTYNKEINLLKDALKEQGKLNKATEEMLDTINNSLLSITEDFYALEDKQFAGYQIQRKIYSDIALAQKEYVENSDENNVFDKDDFTLYISDEVPNGFVYKPNYQEILKTADGTNNSKAAKYNSIRFSSIDKFNENLLEVLQDLDDMDMIDKTNYKYEEGTKRYAGRELFETRLNLAHNNFLPGIDIKDDEEKVKEFYKQKATEFDFDKLYSDFSKYNHALDRYEHVKKKCDKYFSKTDHCTNIDVLREKDADAIITEDTHSSSVLSSAFTILKFYKQYEKDQNKNTLKDFLGNPGSAIRSAVSEYVPQFSNNLLKNKENRGQVLAKLDAMCEIDTTDYNLMVKAMERLEECFSTINPKKEYGLGVCMNLRLQFNQFGLYMDRAQSLISDADYNKVFTQLSIMKDEDYAPEKIASKDYYDYETDKYYEIPDNDMYIRDNKISFKDIYDKATDLVFECGSSDDIVSGRHGVPGTIRACQALASDMYLKHFSEMDAKMQAKFRELATEPLEVLNRMGLGLEDRKIANLDDQIAEFNTAAAKMDEVNKELPIYEKFVVQKENEFNKQYVNLNKQIEKATKKNNMEEVERLKAQQDEMKAKRITTLVRDYNNGRLPESYAINRIQSILSGDLKEVKGIFKVSGYKNAKDYCKANDLEDLSKEEMDQIYESALDEKRFYVQERVGTKEAPEKIDIIAELQRHDQPEITKKVVEGLEQDLEAQETNVQRSKALDLFKNKEKVVDNDLAK